MNVLFFVYVRFILELDIKYGDFVWIKINRKSKIIEFLFIIREKNFFNNVIFIGK